MATSKRRVGVLPAGPPQDLEVHTLVRDGRSLVIASYKLEEPRLPATLTAAEREIVAAALRGLSNIEVARARGTSPRTVANLIARAFRKLGVRSRAELAAKLALPVELG